LRVQRILSRVPGKFPGKGYVEAEVKTVKSRRSIAVAPFALEALKQHRERQLEERAKAGDAWEDHDYVFCTSIGTHVFAGILHSPSSNAIRHPSDIHRTSIRHS
jgi:integrase